MPHVHSCGRQKISTCAAAPDRMPLLTGHEDVASPHMSHPMFRPSVEHLPIVAYSIHADDRNRMRYISPLVTKVLGYTPNECTSEPSFLLERTHPEDREYVHQA